MNMKRVNITYLAVVVFLAICHVNSLCPHHRSKRQASKLVSDLLESGTLTTLSPPPTTPGATLLQSGGSPGVNGPASIATLGRAGAAGTAAGSAGVPGTAAGSAGAPGPSSKSSSFFFFTKRHISLRRLRLLQNFLQYLIAYDPELIPNWVQLSFHDCFGPAGCNGCIELANPSNHGLVPTFDLAMRIKRFIAPYDLSKADFIALLGTEAAKAGAANTNGTLDIPFSVGRKDCPFPLKDIGLPTGDIITTVPLLKREFGLTERQVVALMGAHSLGRARPENTGFNGPWDRTETSLNTGFYFSLNSDNMKPQVVSNNNANSTQWKDGRFLMLHADMILRKQFTTSGFFDEPSCGLTDVNECPDQPITAAYVTEFQDRIKFHTAFSEAFLKMINKSYFHLTQIE